MKIPLALLGAASLTASCAGQPTTPVAPATTVAAPSAPAGSNAPARWTSRDVPLPGATAPASLDYIAYEPPSAGATGGRVWVPVGVTGSVDVLDVASGAMKRVDGFKSAERDAHGKKRVVGPSSVTLGDGFAYVGDRASNEICPVDLKTLEVRPCLTLPHAPDGVAYVARSKQVWVTTPADESMTVLDASTGGRLTVIGTVKVGGAPEGYAVDEAHGLFFTNLEDRNRTVVIDVATRAVKATWSPGCGEDGPRGLAVDSATSFVIVACTDHVQVLDGTHDGALLGRLDTGAGVDNVDYQGATHRLFVAAGKAARLTVAELSPRGELTVVATGDTHEGARNPVADARGTAYVADSPGARVVVLSAGQ